MNKYTKIMNKVLFHKVMRSAVLVCMITMLQPSAWAQLDTIPITGTTIDTTKVYDGTTTANIVTLGEIPVLPYNLVSISAEAHYLDASVGNDKPVIVTFTLSGDDAYRYQTPASITLYADITPLQLTADSVSLQFNREYDGTTNCEVLSPGVLQGILPGDMVGQVVTANYSDPNAAGFISVIVSHSLYGPQANNYTVTDPKLYWASISQRSVVPMQMYYREVKEYDGTDTAEVTRQPDLTNIVEGEDIGIQATVHYDTPEIGDNKPMYAHYTLTGSNTDNYVITADSLLTVNGRIVQPLIFDTLEGEQPFVVTAYGFCENEQVTLRYHVRQGEPAYYRIIFSEEALAAGFDDTTWTNCTITDSIISFSIPDGCPAGRYDATVEFYSTGNAFRFYPITFNVNLSNIYLVVTFDDVISIDNSGRLDGQPNRFRTFQWLHDGELIPNANKPYYQAIGGLDGQYSLMVNMGTDDEAMVCPTTINNTTKATVHLMPSPVVATTTIKLQGFDQGQHQLKVFNSHGILVHSATFEGPQHLLDLSALQQGTYLVTVDGHCTKTLKL